jgi:ClpP class serine protease
MSSKTPKLMNKYIYNTPLLSTQTQLEDIVEYMSSRGNELSIGNDLAVKTSEGSLGEGSIAIIPVMGALTYEETWMDALCGMSSYQGILGMTREAIEQGFSTIILDVNSGGGQAYGAFETAEEFKSLTEAAGVKTIAYVDGMSASAAYALSIGAEEIIANPQSQVGSVGVVSQLRNTSEKDKKEGVSTTYVYAGTSKIPYDKDGSFSKSFIDDLQLNINGLYEDFLTHVSSMRGIEKEAVRSTQAKVYSADKALEIGFIDKIMTRNQFAEYLADIQEEGDNNMSIKSLNIFNKKEETNPMANSDLNKTLEAANADKEAALSQVATMTEALASSVTEVTTLTASLEEVKASLASLQEDNSNKELSARKASLSEVLSKDAVASVFEATKALSSEHFDSILAGYQASYKAESASEEFSELGVEAEAENIAPDMSSVMALIQSNKKTKK